VSCHHSLNQVGFRDAVGVDHQAKRSSVASSGIAGAPAKVRFSNRIRRTEGNSCSTIFGVRSNELSTTMTFKADLCFLGEDCLRHSRWSILS